MPFSKELALRKEKIFRVVKELYGLAHVGYYWHRIVHNVLTEGLRMRPTPSDPALYSRIIDGKLLGIAATQVHDILGAG